MIDGVNYLLPKDAVTTNKSALTGTAVESARLGQAMMGAKLVRLIILDACRNNPTATRSIGGNSRGLARETGPTSVAVVTLMAAGPGQVAQDGAGGAANSPFAIALTQGLTSPGITVGELPGYVQAEVERMTEGEQTPDLQGIWPNVHWSFDPNGPVKAVAVAGADPNKIKWEKDQVFWQSIKDSDDPADFKAYMEAQDRGEISGSFRKLASNRMRAIEKLPPGSFQVASRSAQPGQDLVVSARDAFGRGDYRSAARDWTAAANAGQMGINGEIPDVNQLRIPVKYLANLLTAGDTAPVVRALERMLAMRAYQREKHVEGRINTAALDQVGMTQLEVEDMYHVMAIANYEDRFVIPSAHREYAENTFDVRGGCGFSFGNGCSDGASETSLFGGGKRRTIPIKAEV